MKRRRGPYCSYYEYGSPAKMPKASRYYHKKKIENFKKLENADETMKQTNVLTTPSTMVIKMKKPNLPR